MAHLLDWVKGPNGWMHRPRWKRRINMLLRTFQPGPHKLVVYTRTAASNDDQPPTVLGYGVGFVKHI